MNSVAHPTAWMYQHKDGGVVRFSVEDQRQFYDPEWYRCTRLYAHPVELDPEAIERVARVLCERDIRIKRQWDTAADRLEEMLPRAVNFAWREYVDTAQTALRAFLSPTPLQEAEKA